MKTNLPNFLIVGAAKSGTSSLHNYLNQHPKVFMPSYNKQGMKVKEPRFLIKDLVQHRLHNGVWSWEEYKSLFNYAKDEMSIGESSVLYLYYYEHAIANIKKYLGDNVKIIIMLRNPTDRAYSAFQHVSRGLKEQGSFEDALIAEKGRMEKDLTLTPMVMYKEMGLYYNMVRAYKQNFKNVHIIFYEDFRDNTEQELNRTFKFLGLNMPPNIDFVSRYNVGGRKWKNQNIKNIFIKTSLLKSILTTLMPKSLRKRLRGKLILASKTKVSPMKNETRKALNGFFKEDLLKLSEFLNRDLSNWTE